MRGKRSLKPVLSMILLAAEEMFDEYWSGFRSDWGWSVKKDFVNKRCCIKGLSGLFVFVRQKVRKGVLTGVAGVRIVRISAADADDETKRKAAEFSEV